MWLTMKGTRIEAISLVMRRLKNVFVYFSEQIKESGETLHILMTIWLISFILTSYNFIL